eukprot:SM000054S18112  [mRNA]  locus=s54:486548:487621:+ [translate_table: standard]
MDQFADQLRKARQLGALAPGRAKARLAAQSLQAQEAIVRAMTPLERARPEELDAAQRARVAAECSCTAADVDAVIANYQWAREAERKVSQLKEAGKPLPQTMQEIEALVGSRARFRPGAQTEPSRNAPCPCGSGAKFKR